MISSRDHFQDVFSALRGLLQPLSTVLIVTKDDPVTYYVEAPPSKACPRGMFFGAARIGKTYVSYHLMPVYACPDLLRGMSDRLKKRMQGKSCFNFTHIDESDLAELAALTQAGLLRYRQKGMLGQMNEQDAAKTAYMHSAAI